MIGIVNNASNINGFKELVEILMIQLGVGFVFKDPIQHRSVGRVAGYGGIDRSVDRTRRTTGVKCAETQVIVPRNHGKLPIFFVKVIVVDHHAGVAVIIAYIIMYHEIAYYLFYIHYRF